MDGDHKEFNTMSTAEETKPRVGSIWAIAIAGAHGLLWVGVLAMMLVYVPRFAMIFADFDLDLPVATQWVIACSKFSVQYRFLLLPLIVLLSVADAAILRMLYRHPRIAVLRWLWTSFMLFVPLAATAFTAVTMHIPLIHITAAVQ